MFRDRLARLGAAVRHRRRELGLTQDALGSSHVSKSFISQLEQGTVAPSLETLFHLSDTLQLSAPRLLAMSDPATVAGAALDMAEAAFLLGGRSRANKWLKVLEDAVPVDELPKFGLEARWARYTGMNKLALGDYNRAVTFFEAAADDGDPLTHFWLGIAHRRAGHLLQAMRTWEFIVGMPSVPCSRTGTEAEDVSTQVTGRSLLHAATWRHLLELYEELGEPVEAARARAWLHTPWLSGPEQGKKQPRRGANRSHDERHAPLTISPKPVWVEHSRFLAKLFWNEAQQAWDAANIPQANALARLTQTLAGVYAPVETHAALR